MRHFATVEDMTLLWRPLTADESARAGGLLGIVSDILRQEASRVGKNLDERAASDEGFANVVKSVTVDVTARALMTSTSGEPMSQLGEIYRRLGSAQVELSFLDAGLRKAEIVAG